MYSCKDCGRQFQGGLRINNVSLWNKYLASNRTISDLSILYKCSERTIRRRLSLVVDSFTATYPKSRVRQLIHTEDWERQDVLLRHICHGSIRVRSIRIYKYLIQQTCWKDLTHNLKEHCIIIMDWMKLTRRSL